MAVLLIDIGNSFSKISIMLNNDIESYARVEKERWFNADIQDLFDSVGPIESIFVSSVAGKALEAIVSEVLHNRFHIFPVFLTVQQFCCGFSTDYNPYYSLGVDRWLSMLGASQAHEKGFTVIDAGSAITIDTVINKRHIGGLIAPGLKFLEDSLVGNTQIHMPSKDLECPRKNFLGITTHQAVTVGCNVMMVAYLNSVMLEINAKYNHQHQFILTGGDAEALQPLLDFNTSVETGLIFEGMRAVIKNP